MLYTFHSPQSTRNSLLTTQMCRLSLCLFVLGSMFHAVQGLSEAAVANSINKVATCAIHKFGTGDPLMIDQQGVNAIYDDLPRAAQHHLDIHNLGSPHDFISKYGKHIRHKNAVTFISDMLDGLSNRRVKSSLRKIEDAWC